MGRDLTWHELRALACIAKAESITGFRLWAQGTAIKTVTSLFRGELITCDCSNRTEAWVLKAKWRLTPAGRATLEATNADR